MKHPLAILGSGSMATALAALVAKKASSVRLFCIEPDVEREIRTSHTNEKYLPGCRLPRNVSASDSLSRTVRGAAHVFIASPSHVVVDVLRVALQDIQRQATVTLFSKGFDAQTSESLATGLLRILPPALRRRACVVGGPAVAQELANGSKTAFVVAGPDRQNVFSVCDLLESPIVTTEATDDIIGVSLASALKNAYAIALGMCDGLAYPTNAKALVFTLAIQELADIVRAADGRRETAFGLAGIGDLVTTGFSPHGRNRTYGERLVGASGSAPASLGLGTVEGVAATEHARALARRLRINAPLLEAIGQCLTAEHRFERPFVNMLRGLRIR